MTVRHFTELLAENKNILLKDINAIAELTKLKKFLGKLEDSAWEKRSKAASKKVTQMTEEERKISLMWPDEKRFFLKYKKEHPDNPWGYFNEYKKSIQDNYQKNAKLLQ